LAEGGLLSSVVVDALVGVVVDAGVDAGVRVSAVEALVSGGSLSSVVVEAAVGIAVDTGVDASVRVRAVEALRQVSPTEDVIAKLVLLFADDDQRLRAEAGRTLVALARQHPGSAEVIVPAFVAICSRSTGDGQDTEDLPAVGEAYDALRTLVGEPVPATA